MEQGPEENEEVFSSCLGELCDFLLGFLRVIIVVVGGWFGRVG